MIAVKATAPVSDGADRGLAYIAKAVRCHGDLVCSELANLRVLENLLDYLRKHEADRPPYSTIYLEERLEKTRAVLARVAEVVS